MTPIHLDGDRIFVVHGFLSPEECRAHVERSEAVGYEPATINTDAGAVLNEDVRNNRRVIVDDPSLARRLWVRLEGLVPASLAGHTVVGLNERFRFYRYETGQTFRMHRDGAF